MEPKNKTHKDHVSIFHKYPWHAQRGSPEIFAKYFSYGALLARAGIFPNTHVCTPRQSTFFNLDDSLRNGVTQITKPRSRFRFRFPLASPHFLQQNLLVRFSIISPAFLYCRQIFSFFAQDKLSGRRRLASSFKPTPALVP